MYQERFFVGSQDLEGDVEIQRSFHGGAGGRDAARRRGHYIRGAVEIRPVEAVQETNLDCVTYLLPTGCTITCYQGLYPCPISVLFYLQVVLPDRKIDNTDLSEIDINQARLKCVLPCPPARPSRASSSHIHLNIYKLIEHV